MMNDRSIAETPRNRRMAIHRLHAPAVCRLLICALLVASSGSPGSAWAQMPDNRGVKLNPEDSVPPAYLDTLDERDRVRLDAARQQGDSFVPIFSGRGQAPGYTQPAGGVGSTRSVTESPPALQHQPGGRVTPQPTYEAYSPPRQEGRPTGRPEDRISDLIGVLLQNWSKPPRIVRIRYPAAKPETAAPATSGTPPEPSIPLPPAGGGIYARTIYAVNSDYPGPVLIELLGPPLAGAVATGAFTLSGERMVLRLTSLEYLKPVMDGYTMAAGKGIHFWCFAQSISALDSTWGKEHHKTLLHLAELVQILGFPRTDAEGAEELSKAIGTATFEARTENRSGTIAENRIVTANMQWQAGDFRALVRERLITPDELMTLGPDRQYIIASPKDMPRDALHLHHARYWRRWDSRNLADPNPFVIRKQRAAEGYEERLWPELPLFKRKEMS